MWNTFLDSNFIVAWLRRHHHGRHKNERSSLAESSDTRTAKTPGQQIALGLRRTIFHFFPDLYARLEEVADPRVRRDYTMTEILLGGLFLFIAKQDSRNAMNNDREEPIFTENFLKLFGKRLPHMDTVNDVLVELKNDELEQLKAGLVAVLIEKKVLAKYRLNGYYRVAIDATGVMSVAAGHCDHCLQKTSKNGVTTYFHNVLEAKLITPNGFAISLATEWIENPSNYDKQDCELKAFKRLSWKIKKHFPRLPICIHADGLYPNKRFFEICAQFSWHFIVTLKNGSLKSLWEDIELELLTSKNQLVETKKGQVNVYHWLSDLSYQEQSLSFMECIETKSDKTNRFVFVTDLTVDKANVKEVTASGRLRFKIENEGFNTQKNLGYGLGRKYSRTSNEAMKNYVSLLQIAHFFNQLYELSSLAQPLVQRKTTIKHLWKRLISALLEIAFDVVETLDSLGKIQIRYE